MPTHDYSHQERNNVSSQCAQPEVLMTVSGHGAGILGPSSLEKTAVWDAGAPLAMTLTRLVWPLVDAAGIPHTAEEPLG